jgi:hypothetical protein
MKWWTFVTLVAGWRVTPSADRSSMAWMCSIWLVFLEERVLPGSHAVHHARTSPDLVSPTLGSAIRAAKVPGVVTCRIQHNSGLQVADRRCDDGSETPLRVIIPTERQPRHADERVTYLIGADAVFTVCGSA